MTVRIGLVGTGFWAVAVHGAAVKAAPGMELTAVWGRDGRRTAAAAQELGTAPAGSFDGLLAAVDAVVFAIPPTAQAPFALEAAKAGRHILLEKPIAVTSAEGEQLLDAVADAGTRAYVFFTHLWVPDTCDWLLELRDESGWTRARIDMISSVLRTDNPFSSSPWRRQRGGLWDLGPHALAMLNVVMGPVECVTARIAADGLAHLILEHESGASSTVAVTLNASAQDRYDFLFEGNRVESPKPVGPPTIEKCRDAAGRALTALTAEKPPPQAHFVRLTAGLDVVRVLETAERSAAEGRCLAVSH
jgi:predicted dehydrogenase